MGIGAVNRCMETDKRNQALQMLGQALHVARCVETRDERAWLYVQISYTLLKAGEHHRARELVEKCLRMTVGSNLPSRDAILRWAAGVLAELGEFERAWHLLCLVREAQQRNIGLSSFAKALACAAHWAHALKVARMIDEEDERYFALYRVIQQMAKVGEIELALDAMRNTGPNLLQAVALKSAAEAQIEKGLTDSAQATLQKATWRARRGQLVFTGCEIAELWARVGHGYRARGLLREARCWAQQAPKDEDFPVDLRLCDVAAAQARNGFFQDAIDTSMSISDRVWRAYALDAIAHQLVRHGKRWEAQNFWKQALHLARGCEEPFNRSSVLRTIAEAYAKAGYKKEARQLFEEAIREALGADEKSWEPEMLIKDVAVGQAEVGMLPDALRTARRLVSKPYAYADTLNGIAEVLLQSKVDEEE